MVEAGVGEMLAHVAEDDDIRVGVAGAHFLGDVGMHHPVRSQAPLMNQGAGGEGGSLDLFGDERETHPA